jgi:hypothetical protein
VETINDKKQNQKITEETQKVKKVVKSEDEQKEDQTEDQ